MRSQSLILVIWLASSCPSALAQVTDVLLFDGDEKYINPEISGDGLHVTFTTVLDPLFSNERTVIYDEIDELGFPIGGVAKGRLVAGMAEGGLAYWGETAHVSETCPGFNGHYSVFLGTAGYFTVLFARDGEPPCVRAIGPGDDPTVGAQRIRRKIPFPMRNAQSGGLWVAYQVRDREERKISKYLVDLSTSPLAPLLFDEEKFVNESGQRANALTHWPWWAGGTSQLYFLTFDGCIADCIHRVARLDANELAVGAQVVANAAAQMVGLYPFVLNGQSYLYFGLNDRPYGIFYEETLQDTFNPIRTLAYDVVQSTLFPSDGSLDIYNIQSMESFQWQGEAYASYTVSERTSNGQNQAFANQTEVWVVKLDSLQTGETMIRCRVSEDDIPGNTTSRTEPEPVVRGDEAYIYYTAGVPVTAESDYQYRWRRIQLGDRSVFDESCASGTIWNSARVDGST